MAIAFRRIVYRGTLDRPSWCDGAVYRHTSAVTVLREDREDNPGTAVGQCIEGLAAMLWRAELYDLDASMIRWFQVRGTEVSQVRFCIVPDGRGGFFAMPRWEA